MEIRADFMGSVEDAMEASGHTPGPWSPVQADSLNGGVFIETVCVVCGERGSVVGGTGDLGPRSGYTLPDGACTDYEPEQLMSSFDQLRALQLCQDVLASAGPSARVEIMSGAADVLISADGKWRGKYNRRLGGFEIVFEAEALPVGYFVKF